MHVERRPASRVRALDVEPSADSSTPVEEASRATSGGAASGAPHDCGTGFLPPLFSSMVGVKQNIIGFAAFTCLANFFAAALSALPRSSVLPAGLLPRRRSRSNFGHSDWTRAPLGPLGNGRAGSSLPLAPSVGRGVPANVQPSEFPESSRGLTSVTFPKLSSTSQKSAPRQPKKNEVYISYLEEFKYAKLS